LNLRKLGNQQKLTHVSGETQHNTETIG